MTRRMKAPLSALANRMREDLILSGKRPKTVTVYLSAVRQMARHYNTSPEKLTEQQVRAYLVYLTDKKKRPVEHFARL